jgi:glycosyltransferase involved in cell wall biosynthesis
MVTSETGILVPAVDAAQVHRDLTQALTRAAEDAALRRRLGAAARRRAVERYVWQTKGAQLADLYTRLVQAE